MLVVVEAGLVSRAFRRLGPQGMIPWPDGLAVISHLAPAPATEQANSSERPVEL